MSDNSRVNLKKLFSYVRALSERRFANVQNYKAYPFCLRLSDLPEHRTVTLHSFSDSADEPVPADGELILTVGKADVPAPPGVPDELIGWLANGWNDPSAKLEYIESHEMPSPEPGETATELFEDEPRRPACFEAFAKQREKWAETSKAVYAARKLYEQFYALYSELERNRDAMELMVGDGILETELEDGTKICHPLVLERVSLTFNSAVPDFSISDCEANPMLYTALLRAIPGIECGSLSEFSDKIETELIHPFEGERFEQLLRELANSLSHDCEYVAPGAKSTAKYVIRRGAVLFTRQRSSGYSAILDKIIADIDTAEELSPSLLSIVGQGGEQTAAAADESSAGRDAMEINGISADVLLEKAANREQLLIAKKYRTSPAVIVQGPPGTGKTHTISNIIGDLLARGESVLVTSQTSKALDVLRDKISEPIRPLCVSVLDDNRRQLEESLRVINEMISANDNESLDREAARFEKERAQVIAELTQLKERLVALVEREYRPMEIDGVQYTPKQAAKYIRSLSDSAFIPDAVDADTVLPLSEDEIKTLYKTNAQISAYEEDVLESGAPDTAELITPARFAQICSIIDPDARDEQSDSGNSLWQSGVEREASVLSDLSERFRQVGSLLESAASTEPWKLQLAGIGAGSSDRALFERISESIEKLREQSANLSLEIADSRPSIPDELINDSTLELLKDMYHSLETEKLNFLTLTLHPKWNALLDRCRVNGEEPRTRSQIKLLGRYVQLKNGRLKLINRWQQAIGELQGGPKLGSDRPEEQAAAAWPVVADWLNFYEKRWQPLVEELKALGFRWDRYFEAQPLEAKMSGEIAAVRAMLSGGMSAGRTGGSLPDIIDMEYARGDRNECADELDRLSRLLLPYSEKFAEIGGLRTAIADRDREGYNRCYDAYDTIRLKKDIYEKRMELLERLSKAAPLWAEGIRSRCGANGGENVPASVGDHWLRARMCGCLDAVSADETAKTQKRIEELNSQLSALTRELITRRAWSAQIRTMQEPGRKRALETWATLVKRVGKGTGKRAEQLLASGELRRAMKECRKAVPVWIMPVNAIAENFEPSNDKFDVLIIDEASQADLTALIALYLARKVIVVGDDKQVSPTPIGLELEVANKLRREFLEGVPAAAMYDELVSIYDLGRANYQPITLREHFRSASDIINFSNYYTYNGIIQPLRDSSSLTLRPSTVGYRVKDGAATGKKTNRPEAEAIASLIAACIEQPEYEGSTFGVITMLGDEQALMIDRMLRQRLSENVYQKRQILCGNPSYFQGDERDVIFISLVDASKESGGMLTVRREGYNELYAKRFNVAASRARDQMWVVYSMDPDTELKSDDIRLSLIRHALDPAATAAALEKKQPTALGDMEKAVEKALTDAGYNVYARRKVGSYIIGMTCEGVGGRIAVECDGDAVRDSEEVSEEIGKQSVLERLGWRFIRLRASDYYRDPEAFSRGVVEQVRAAGIKPDAARSEQDEGSLIERVTARAAEILEQWKNSAPEEDTGSSPQEGPAESMDVVAAQEVAAPETADKPKTRSRTKAKPKPQPETEPDKEPEPKPEQTGERTETTAAETLHAGDADSTGAASTENDGGEQA